MKGIVLAGGIGSRLYPLTKGVTKHLLPVFNKPLIYYPISALMLAGIREVLIISDPRNLQLLKRVLMDGRQWGMSFQYAQQEEPRGLPEAFLIGESFIGDSPVCLVLGDNIFYGRGLTRILENASQLREGATGIVCHVRNPKRYGVVEFSDTGEILSIEEKPEKPRSSFALTGIYFCDSGAVEIASSLTPSSRGELEIVELWNHYLRMGRFDVHHLGRGMTWMDAGTPTSLMQASVLVEAIEQRLGLMISSPEEIALRKKFITLRQFKTLCDSMPSSDYRAALLRLWQETGKSSSECRSTMPE
jgi:glucose-1-phosphate thymidylyltransferase